MSTNSVPAPLQKGAAIVTGAAQGIGRAIAVQLARDGFPLLATDMPSKQDALDALVVELIAAGHRAAAVGADVTDEGDVRRMIEVAVRDLGPLEVVRASVLLLRDRLTSLTSLMTVRRQRWRRAEQPHL
jgi:NAD(P)-dependent dehydrogenase (short-subunit alcohol dehydrogenase family)